MNHDEIIRIAKEAGYVELANDSAMYPPDFFERFAALVAAAEREACAKVCDEHVVPVSIEGAHPDYLIGKQMAFQQAAQAIRERGER